VANATSDEMRGDEMTAVKTPRSIRCNKIRVVRGVV
jgi:hypothetical protein